TPDLAELGELCGCTEKQVRFAEGMLQGMNQSDAAHHAGYAGEPGSVAIRSAGSTAARAKPVQALLALAESKGMGIPSAPGDMEELKRILWVHARSKSRQQSIQATEVLMELEEKEKAEKKVEPTPREAFKEIANLDPDLAAIVGAHTGAPSDWLPEVRGTAHLEQLASRWIKDNPERALEIARFYLRQSIQHNQPTNGAGN